jgi:hypothetical protein
VFGILLHMPRVEFVNLSLNRLEEPIIELPACPMNTLRSLVLNNTKLDWYSVDKLLKLLPSLEELHLSLNEYKRVLLDTLLNDESNNDDIEQQNDCNINEKESSEQDEGNVVKRLNDFTFKLIWGKSFTSVFDNGCKQTKAHDGVKKLYLNGNPISDWSEICRLGRLFPNLETLVLAECPLRWANSNSQYLFYWIEIIIIIDYLGHFCLHCRVKNPKQLLQMMHRIKSRMKIFSMFSLI